MATAVQKQDKVYSEDFKVFRANKSGTGFAASFSVRSGTNNSNAAVFLTIAPQVKSDGEDGAAVFAWKEKGIIVKLGSSDLGEIISVLEGLQDSAGGEKGLYHTSAKGSKSILFTRGQNKGFYLQVSASDENKKPAGKGYVNISDGESRVLLALLKEAVVKMYRW